MGHGAQAARSGRQRPCEQYFETAPQDFLAVATPGAGKTTFALRVATELVERGLINRITVVAPTDHLKRQWADAAARVGLAIDPNFKNADGSHGRDFIGVAVTYAQVAMQADAAPGQDRGREDAGDPGRNPPRRRRAQLGRRHPRGLRTGRPPAGADRYPVPLRHRCHSRSWNTPKTRTASAARGPTTPTATAARCATTWCAR